MTEERMALLEFVRKSGEPDFVRALLQFTVQRLMECEVEGRCGAARHERTWPTAPRSRPAPAEPSPMTLEEWRQRRQEPLFMRPWRKRPLLVS